MSSSIPDKRLELYVPPTSGELDDVEKALVRVLGKIIAREILAEVAAEDAEPVVARPLRRRG